MASASPSLDDRVPAHVRDQQSEPRRRSKSPLRTRPRQQVREYGDDYLQDSGYTSSRRREVQSDVLAGLDIQDFVTRDRGPLRETFSIHDRVGGASGIRNGKRDVRYDDDPWDELEWDRQREMFLVYYVTEGRTLEEAAGLMKTLHRFSASPALWRRHLRRWRWQSLVVGGSGVTDLRPTTDWTRVRYGVGVRRARSRSRSRSRPQEEDAVLRVPSVGGEATAVLPTSSDTPTVKALDVPSHGQPGADDTEQAANVEADAAPSAVIRPRVALDVESAMEAHHESTAWSTLTYNLVYEPLKRPWTVILAVCALVFAILQLAQRK